MKPDLKKLVETEKITASPELEIERLQSQQRHIATLAKRFNPTNIEELRTIYRSISEKIKSLTL